LTPDNTKKHTSMIEREGREVSPIRQFFFGCLQIDTFV